MRCIWKARRRRLALLPLLALLPHAAPLRGADSSGPRVFHVDPTRGDDAHDGSLAAPLRTLSAALAAVDARVKHGLRSDKIYLRAGVYRNDTAATKWRLNLRGTPDDYALISAMPAAPNTPGAVQRGSGAWYERVVFDDAQAVRARWTRVPDKPHLWQMRPGLVRLEWTQQNLWPWRGAHLRTTERDATPRTTAFTVAPFMLLQDDQPLLWADTPDEIAEPGVRTYHQETDTLVVRPLGDVDPNGCAFETWYGGPEKSGDLLLLDGEGRAFFDGDLLYAGIRGCEFRMFTRLFEFHRQGYEREADRAVQRHVVFEDNFCRDGWIHLLLDANTVHACDADRVLPRYGDRSDWIVRYNLFLRPAREVFQVHGDDHVFEQNHIHHHGGPWAGPAAIVSAVNARNSRNIQVRFNTIVGQGDNRWHDGSVFMIEVGPSHADSSGDCLCGGQTYEGNLFVNLTAGAGIVLGKAGCRLTNVTIRDNIFAGHREGPAIRIGTTQANLRIEDNIFHDVRTAIQVQNPRDARFSEHPSTGAIRHNVFVKNETTLDAALLPLAGSGALAIDGNQFFANRDQPVGTNAVTADPGFRDPAALDFRRTGGSAKPAAGAGWQPHIN